MLNPVIFINDPVKKDYSEFILSILPQFSNCFQLDIVILSPISTSNDLNFILCKYYQLVRNYIESNLDLFDYRFEINILFNLSHEKLLKLIENSWNKGYIIDNEVNIIRNLPISLIKSTNISLPNEISSSPSSSIISKNNKNYQEFNICAVGGTFDHLHDGHKILLSMSLFLTFSKLIIGITGSSLLLNKKFNQVLQSFDIRKSSVLNFIQLIHPLISGGKLIEFYEINDICGPTGYISNIDSLIISEETTSGGEFVNKYRKDHGFKQLDITSIKVIGDEQSNSNNSWKGKLSSTDIRQREYNRVHINN